MSTTRRQQVLALVALCVAAGVGWWLSAPSDLIEGPLLAARTPTPVGVAAGPARGVAPGSSAGRAGDAVESAQPDARAAPWPQPDAAALRAWSGEGAAATAALAKPVKPVAVAVATAAASAPLRAPAPAWRFVGRIQDGTAVRAMLLTAQQLRVVAEQESLDAEWRVERIGEQGVELIWLPGDQRVRLAWASS